MKKATKKKKATIKKKKKATRLLTFPKTKHVATAATAVPIVTIPNSKAKQSDALAGYLMSIGESPLPHSWNLLQRGEWDPSLHTEPTDTPFLRLVVAELARARTKHPTNHRNAHETLGVMIEEAFEWFLEVIANNRIKQMKELVQLGAMVMRAAEDVYEL